MVKSVVIQEANRVLSRVLPEAGEKLAAEILAARRVFVGGAGRSGLLVRAFAMRLLHLGFRVYVTGETITPAIQKGDVLVACSGSGETATTRHFIQVARRVGARVCLITAHPESTLAAEAHDRIVLPAGSSGQLGNSLFEQALFIFLEEEVELLRRRTKGNEKFQRMHANLE